MRLLEDADLIRGLSAALDGGPPVAPVPEKRALGSLGLDQPVTEPDAAVVVATSGSTGTPKAVVLGRSGIRHAVAATHRYLGGAGDWVCALPTRHVAGLMTIARGVLAGRDVSFARPDLSDLPAAGERAYLSLVAAQLDRALEDPALTRRLAGYAAILVGGSALPAGLRSRAGAAGVRLIATYGMSETCGGCVYDGQPLDRVRVEFDQGLIQLGGPMVFLGYRLQPELTAEVLSGDVVRTKDRGRWRGGRLEVLGRSDDLVITGGAKVDLGQLQTVCDAEFGPGVLAVLAVPDARWGQRVVALSTQAMSLATVQQRLDRVVGKDARPRELRIVPGLAYTTIGKIDRAALLRLWQESGEHGDTG